MREGPLCWINAQETPILPERQNEKRFLSVDFRDARVSDVEEGFLFPG